MFVDILVLCRLDKVHLNSCINPHRKSKKIFICTYLKKKKDKDKASGSTTHLQDIYSTK